MIPYFDYILSLAPNEKDRLALQFLGRWQFIKEWLESRACPELLDIARKMDATPQKFRPLFPQDEEVIVKELESLDSRKLKVCIS
jgi:hypothetical protein